MAIVLDAKKKRELNHRAALKVFFNIMDLWCVVPKDVQILLGLNNRQTYYDWKNKGSDKIGHDTEERISHILGIYKDLQILFSDTLRADRWVKRPNKFFKNRSPLDVMLDGSILDIARVRSYLDTKRG